MSEIMKITNERQRQKSKDREMQRSTASYSESVRAKWFFLRVLVRFCPINT